MLIISNLHSDTVVSPSTILIMLSGAMRDSLAAAGAITLNFKQLYLGMLLPVGLLFCSYLVYIFLVGLVKPELCPARPSEERRRPTLKRLVIVLIAPLLLIVLMP